MSQILFDKIENRILIDIMYIVTYLFSNDRTYGSVDSATSSTSPGRSTRPRMAARQRKRTISTTEMLNEVERFSRRTISVCGAPPPIISGIDVTEDVENATETAPSSAKDRDDALSISNLETIVHILKGNIGIGVLTLPMAIRNSGLVFGSLGLIFIAYLCVYCMMLLVNAAHRVRNNYLLTF